MMSHNTLSVYGIQAEDRPGRRADGVPLPIVNLSRAIFAVAPVVAFFLDAPLILGALFVVDLLPLVLGRRWSLVSAIGRVVFDRRTLADAEYEDRRIIAFNRTLVVALLAVAQVAILLGAPVVGWAAALMVASANGLALAGFCIGCFLYYQLRLFRYRFGLRG